MKRGLTHLCSGNGKGKAAAALGPLFRAYSGIAAREGVAL